MSKFGYIILVFAVLTACQEVQYPDPPEQLIPKEKMVQILADAYITNASRSRGVNNRILRSKGIKLDSLLYTKHGIDSLSFAKSNSYYASNLEQYTEIITAVEKLLTRKKAEIDSIANAAKNKSLKKPNNTPVKTVTKLEEGELDKPAQDEEE
jgi:hypothetical protein